MSNERDRPSLALPRAQAVTDVLAAFGASGLAVAAESRGTQPRDTVSRGKVEHVISIWLGEHECTNFSFL